MTTKKATVNIFPIKTFISDLPDDLLPRFLTSSENGPATGRLIIVGDVHGMRKSLEALLEKVGFDKQKGDHLILVGDLVNKGPDSPGVIDLAIKLGASAVRGNHENAVLNAAAYIKSTGDSLQNSEGLTGSPAVPEDPEADPRGETVRDAEIPDNPAFSAAGTSKKPSATTQNTALALSASQLDWLAGLPLILRIKLPQNLTASFGDTLVVVHAGLVPNIPLEDQDPYYLLHIRSLTRTPGDGDEFVPAETHGEESWVREWDQWQDKVASKTTVIFGHDAKRRLQLGRYAIGLDSGCLYGNKLSALVIAAIDGEVDKQIVQVEYADTPVAPTPPVKGGDKKAVE
ncbi:Metallo-dependent phosphatase [Penicillium sp. IBT 35674x]|nr:Metallo-dependent phosphatase [Penicillium sp. IBT 35674x]